MNSSTLPRRQRSSPTHHVIALSLGYERDHLLARGVGLEHLREMLIRIARPILQDSASIAYGGHWRPGPVNFLDDLLRLISAEQVDNSIGGPDTDLQIGRLYNHSAWPLYLEITPRIEAQWINCCRIIRISQQLAGISEDEIIPDEEANVITSQLKLNQAITLAAMRRLAMGPLSFPIPEAGKNDLIPPITARVALGGKVTSFSGMMPGIFEESLVTLQHQRPLFLLGGFGGASEVLARAILEPSRGRPPELTVAWHQTYSPGLAELKKLFVHATRPASVPSIEEAFDQLWNAIQAAQAAPATALRTGLTDDETRTLLGTRDMNTAVKLVGAGLKKLKAF